MSPYAEILARRPAASAPGRAPIDISRSPVVCPPPCTSGARSSTTAGRGDSRPGSIFVTADDRRRRDSCSSPPASRRRCSRRRAAAGCGHRRHLPPCDQCARERSATRRELLDHPDRPADHTRCIGTLGGRPSASCWSTRADVRAGLPDPYISPSTQTRCPSTTPATSSRRSSNSPRSSPLARRTCYATRTADCGKRLVTTSTCCW